MATPMLTWRSTGATGSSSSRSTGPSTTVMPSERQANTPKASRHIAYQTSPDSAAAPDISSSEASSTC